MHCSHSEKERYLIIRREMKSPPTITKGNTHSLLALLLTDDVLVQLGDGLEGVAGLNGYVLLWGYNSHLVSEEELCNEF